MIKKMLSLALALLLVLSVAAVGFSAAQIEVAEEAAGVEVADVAADSDVASAGAESEVAATGDGCVVKFDAASAGWSGATILFYIYDLEAGQELAAWGSKKLAGTADGDIYSFDASTIGVVDGKQYFIIFNNKDTTAETYQLLMDTSCAGDTAYVTGNKIENPVDSNKSSLEAKWQSNSLGPRLAITSLGNVVGETCPAHTTPYAMFVKFLTSDGKDGLQNAIKYSGKTQDELIESVSAALGLTDEDVAHAIDEAGLGGDPGLYSLEGSVTSYLDDSDVTLTLEGSRITAHSVIDSGKDYSFEEIPADTYTLTVKKDRHVDRVYTVKVTGDTTLDVKICPLGDVTMDGQITTMDATRANAHVKGTAPLKGYALLCADVLPNTAGITTMDVTRINSHVQKVKPLW